MRNFKFAMLAVAVLSGCDAIGRLSEKIASNSYSARAPLTCSIRDACPELPADLWIADLHADTLLWQRDIRDELPSNRTAGHVDVAKLKAGKADLQIFAVVTHTPLPQRPTGLAPWNGTRDRCADRNALDTQVLLKMQELYQDPWRLFSIRKRGMWQIKRFHDWVEDAESGLSLVASANALNTTRPAGSIGVMLSVEGLNWVHGTPDQIRSDIEQLANRNVRMASLTHRFSNALAASSEDCALFRAFTADRGLTDQGQVAISAMIDNGVIVDLAHSSPQTISDISLLLQQMAETRAAPQGRLRPVVSHGGIFDVCESARNLTAQNIREIVMADGVIGVGFWEQALCFENKNLETIYRHFALSLMAIVDAVNSEDYRRAFAARSGRPLDPLDHIALGSDFDGAVKMYFDVSGVPDLLSYLASVTCDDLIAGAKIELGRRLSEVCHAPEGGSGPLLPLSTQPDASGKPGSLNRLAGENARGLLRGALTDG